MKKKIVVLFVIGLALAGTLSAQNWGGGHGGYPPGQNAEKASISGKLMVANGMVALQSDGKTYYVRGFQQLIGFIDGLKEGASVSLEGYSYTIPYAADSRVFLTTKLTFNGKSYDLSAGPNWMMSHRNNAPPPNRYHE